MAQIKTTAENITLVFDEKGNPIYPCRCGEIHRGDYALYDFEHHNCFHENDLIGSVLGKFIQVFCPNCGMLWRVKIY